MGDPATPLSPELREEALDTLRSALREESRWVKVHAAEALLSLGYPEGVREAFLAEYEQFGEEPQYRIGIFRVLAKAAQDPAENEAWGARIRAAFDDPDGPDRVHAAETLAKLGYTPAEEELPGIRELAKGAGPLAMYTRWIEANADPAARRELLDLLDDPDPAARSTVAYALRHLGPLDAAAREALIFRAKAEAEDSPARVYLLGAAFVNAPEDAVIKTLLLDYVSRGTIAERYEALNALGAAGDNGDLAVLKAALEDSEADPRIAAALGMLRIERRAPHRLAALDWLVIALYAAGMLSIGWYYARHTATTEDYLLGGRTMRPMTVGLSMFATLLSTISYLSWPGEIIRHGPMFAAQYLAHPISFLVIGWFLIPYIMRLRVTSAYEILESRLGLSVRMFGSTIFLSLRLLWMSVIIYATGSKVLVPMMGWDPAVTPIVCAALGLLTVLYTSMGGLRAVVMTDVIQTAILFAGAILTVIIITVRMGGVTAWWPEAWSPGWDPPAFFINPAARVTIMGAMMSCFIWQVCTAGSDQVAIQRYLATRDKAAARRVIMTSLTADACVGMMLAMLGLALFAYFNSHPFLLQDGQEVFSNADKLFPRFIVIGFPAGLTGLVVAGLLAAAMSSLSSGVNSACSVITVDFLRRFRRAGHPVESGLKQVRWVSAIIGVVVVLLSIVVGQTSGNLLEVAYKVVNLLTAPLFVLFFMAMFVPWATAFGTLVAGACSITMAVGIAYGAWFGLSFLWIMPMALLTGIGTGMLASLPPIGQRVRDRIAGESHESD